MAESVGPLITVALCATLAAALTPLFAVFARRCGMVVAPRADRWHLRATPLLGGGAIAVAALMSIIVLAPDLQTATVVVTCAGAAVALGLADDLWRLSPNVKLVTQVVIGSALVIGGIQARILGIPALDFVVTVFWIVAIMNAVNLMDNMDGLAGGIVAIAGAALALTSANDGGTAAIVGASAAGAALGFLVHNFHPARVFMGDAGSQLLGFLLAAAALMHTTTGAANIGIAVLAPLTVLALPIFDTALVTTSRRLARQPIGRGGRDHTSHRLAALGLSDRGAVLMLYGVAATMAGVALIAERATLLFFPLLTLAVIALVLFGLFLFEVDVYGRKSDRAEPRTPIGRAMFIYGRFGFEVALDVVLITTAYFLAHVLRFESSPQSAWIDFFTLALPFVVGCQLAALVLTDVYRTLWRFVGLPDAVRIMRATALGTAAAALVLLLGFRFEGLSRAVFLLDWLIVTILLLSSRGFLIALRHWFAGRPRTGERRALIVGATEAGAMAVRLLSHEPEGGFRAVGFLDDDVSMRRRLIAGVPVVGRIADLEAVVTALRADLVFLAIDRDEAATAELRRTCEALGLEWREFHMSGSMRRMAEGS